MGILLDAYALIAYLAGERAGAEVRRLLDDGDAAISTVNLAEAGQKVVRDGALRSDELEHLVETLPLAIIAFSRAHAWRAAELRAKHYQRRDSAVSLADCCLVAVATSADRVATADPAVLRMAEAEGARTIELPRP